MLIKGETSLQGETSLDDAVLEPPGDSIGWDKMLSSFGMIKERPVAEEDFTMDFRIGLITDGEGGVGEKLLGFPPEKDEVTRGLGVLGWTESLGVTGRLRGLTKSKAGLATNPADLTSVGILPESSE